MKIPEDIRKYAADQAITEEALANGREGVRNNRLSLRRHRVKTQA